MTKQLLLFTYLIIIPEGEFASVNNGTIHAKGNRNYLNSCDDSVGYNQTNDIFKQCYNVMHMNNVDHDKDYKVDVVNSTQFDFIMDETTELELHLNTCNQKTCNEFIDCKSVEVEMWKVFPDNGYESVLLNCDEPNEIRDSGPYVFSILILMVKNSDDRIYQLSYNTKTTVGEFEFDDDFVTDPTPIDDDFIFSDADTSSEETDGISIEFESTNLTSTIIEGSTDEILVENISQKDVVIIEKTIYETNNYQLIPTEPPIDSEVDVVDLAVELIVEEEKEIEELKAEEEEAEYDIDSSNEKSIELSTSSNRVYNYPAKLEAQLDPFVFTVDMSIASVAAVSFTVMVIIAIVTALILFVCDRLRKMRVVGVWRKDLHHLLNNDVEKLIKPEKQSFDNFIQTDRTAVFTR